MVKASETFLGQHTFLSLMFAEVVPPNLVVVLPCDRLGGTGIKL